MADIGRCTSTRIGAVLAGLVVVAGALVLPARAGAVVQSGGEFVALQARLRDATASGASTVEVQAAGVVGIPSSGVSAVQVTVMALQWPGDGWVSAWPSDVDPATLTGSNVLASAPGERVSNTTIVALSPWGSFKLKQTAAGRVVVDVQGYFTVASGAGGGYRPVAPKRIADTRTSTQPTSQPGVTGGQKLVANAAQTVQIEGVAGVPPSATAVFVNLTLIDPASEGYLYVWPENAAGTPTSIARPMGNFSAGVAVKLSPSGKVAVKSTSAVHLVVDVVGYFEATTGEDGSFTPAAARVAYVASLGPGASVAVKVAGVQGIPGGYTTSTGGVTAVALNLTTNSAAAHAGYLDIASFELGAAPRYTTALAYDADASDARSNRVTIGVGSGGSVWLKNTSQATVRISVDVQGYYTRPPSNPGLCGLAADQRLTSTYVTPTPYDAADPYGSMLLSPDQDTRDQAWGKLVSSLYGNLCLTGVTLPFVEVNDCTATDPASCATRERYYQSAGGRPLAAGGTQTDALGSLFHAIAALDQELATDGEPPSGFTVAVGDRNDTTPNGTEPAPATGLRSVTTSAQAASWASAQAGATTAVWQDVWNSYPADRNRISGWHITLEPDQTVDEAGPYSTPQRREAFRRYLAAVTPAVHATAPGTAVGVSPAYDIPHHSATANEIAAEWGTFLTELLTGSGVPGGQNVVDTLEIQDRLWAYQRDAPGALVLDSAHRAMVPYLAQARQLVDERNSANVAAYPAGSSNRSQMRLVSDVELFDLTSGDALAPVPVSLITAAIAAERPYVDGFTSYTAQAHLAWGWYGAAWLTWAAPNPQGWAYQAWLRSASAGAAPQLEDVRPDPLTDTGTSANRLRVRQVGADVRIDVRPTDGPSAANPATDGAERDEGASWIAQVWLYRKIDGGPKTLLTVCTRGGRSWLLYDCTSDHGHVDEADYAPPTVFEPWTLIDAQVPAGSTVSYQVVAVNATGRTSATENPWTAPLTVAPGAHGATNLVFGKGYRAAPAPVTTPPERADTGHSEWGPGELDDGATGTASPFDPAWQAFSGTGTEIVFDLGAAKTVAAVEVEALFEPQPAIFAPVGITAELATTPTGAGTALAATDPVTGDATAAIGLPPWGAATRQDPSTPPTKTTYRLTGTATGRYLRVRIPPAPWAFISEIRAFPPA